VVRELISAETIALRVQSLGREIADHYRPLLQADPGGELVLVGLLKGSFVFVADLCRAIDLPHRVEFLSVSSYGAGTESSGEVRIQQDLDGPVAGKHLLLVEDIVDSGRTVVRVAELLGARRPASVKLCALLDKPSRRTVAVVPDWRGFEVEDLFVVGYGMDHDQRWRHLPFVGESAEMPAS
jgi:hypoxanthine phosphoribosyltransferase